MPNHGDLKVWHIPQVPMKPFEVPVVSLVEAKLILDTLAVYDAFQFDNRIKPDYASASGLSFFDAYDNNDNPDGSWCDWYDNDDRCIDDYSLEELRSLEDAGRLPECCYQ